MFFRNHRFTDFNIAKTSFLFSFVTLSLLTTSLLAQEKVRSDQRLPPGVLLYSSTPDIPGTYEAFKNTSYGQLINGPELEEFRVQLIEKFEAEASDGIQKIEEELGMPLSDLVALFAGDASFAVLRPIGAPLGVVAMMEYGDHDDILGKLLSRLEAEIEKGTELVKSTEEYAGTEISVFTIETEHPDYQTVDISYFRKDGHLVVASSLSLVESVLDRWDGKNEQTFANDELYAAILEQCATTDGSTPDMVTFFNPIGLATAGLGLVPQAKPFVNLVPLYLPTLGLNRLKATGSAMEVDAEDFNLISKSMVYVERPATGMLKMFELRPTLTGPPTWVPADATQYFGLDWNIAGAYEAVESVYDGFLGPGSFNRQITDLTRQANQENLHIKKDIIDVLSGKMEGFMIQEIEALGPEPELDLKFAASIGVTDEDKAWKLIEAAMKTTDDVEEQQVRGNRVIVFSSPDGKEISLTIQGKQIFIAASAEGLSNTIAGKSDGPALIDSADYKQAKAHLPEQMSMLSYQSPATQLRAPYEALRNGEFDSAVEGDFDFSVLPPFEKIEKYFTPSFGYLMPVEKGAFSVQFGLKPQE